jgi:hypothetical protein
MICCAVAVRSENGFKAMKNRPLLAVLPPPAPTEEE